MTSRTPVGILVIALSGLLAVGCSAQTTAVFQSFLDPAVAVPAVPTDPSAAASDAVDGSGAVTWWPHPDGYAMNLPAGWNGVALDEARAGQLMAAVQATQPELAARIVGVLATTQTRVSAVAVDGSAVGELGPILIVLAQPAEDRGAHAVKSLVKEQIAGLPGLSGGPFRADVTYPTVTGVRFEFTIDDPDVGTLQVRAVLFRFGSDAYLVTFVAPVEDFEAAEAIFEAIVASLRFGV